MRALAACLMGASFLIYVSAFFAGGQAQWAGQLVSAFGAALFATLWAIDR